MQAKETKLQDIIEGTRPMKQYTMEKMLDGRNQNH
jgi:hypothetical protein